MILRSNFDPGLIQQAEVAGATIPLRCVLPNETIQKIVVDPAKKVDLGMQGVNACEGTLWLYDKPAAVGILRKLLSKTREDIGRLLEPSTSVVIVECDDDAAQQEFLNALGETESSKLGERTLLISATPQAVREMIFNSRYSLSRAVIPSINPDEIIERAQNIFMSPHVNIANDLKCESVAGRNLKESLDKIDIADIIIKVCSLLDIPIPKDLPFYIPEAKNSGSHTFSNIQIDYKTTSFSEAQSRATMTVCREYVARRKIAVDFERLHRVEHEYMCVHELAHYLLPNMPDNETLKEGMAEASCWLYACVFNKRNFWRAGGSPSQRIYQESGGPGRYLPDFSQVPQTGGMHLSQGYMASSAILEGLGKTIPERLFNIGKIAQASSWDSLGKGSGIMLPSTEEWFRNINDKQPGLGTSLKELPTLQPMQTGTYIEFHPVNHGDSSSLWGMLTCFKFEKNGNFGVSEPFNSRFKKLSSLGDFDLNPGAITHPPFKAVIKVGDRKQFPIEVLSGSLQCSPKLIPYLLTQNPTLLPGFFLEKDVTITATVEGKEYTLVENTRFTEEDLQTLGLSRNTR